MSEPQRDHLVHIVSSSHWGGVEQYALDICRHYHDRGWHVTAVTRDAKVVDSRFMSYGIPLRHTGMTGFMDLGSILTIAKLFRTLPHARAVVHTHRDIDTFMALAAKRLIHRPDIRVVTTRHVVSTGYDTPMFRRMCAKTDANIFVSQMALDTFVSPWRDRKSPLPPDRVHVLHNSLNLDSKSYIPEPIRGPVTAVCHGTIVAGKGFETIIDALSTLRDIKVRLRIAGQGDPDYLDSLRNRAITRGVMEMIDWLIPAGNIEMLIAESHFGVQASGRREAFGLESLRYMAMGRAQVCVPNGAQYEYLEDGRNALFAPPADSSRLAEAMRRLATDPVLRHTLGENARADYLERLDWQHFVARLDKIYNP